MASNEPARKNQFLFFFLEITVLHNNNAKDGYNEGFNL